MPIKLTLLATPTPTPGGPNINFWPAREKNNNKGGKNLLFFWGKRASQAFRLAFFLAIRTSYRRPPFGCQLRKVATPFILKEKAYFLWLYTKSMLDDLGKLWTNSDPLFCFFNQKCVKQSASVAECTLFFFFGITPSFYFLVFVSLSLSLSFSLSLSLSLLFCEKSLLALDGQKKKCFFLFCFHPTCQSGF